MTESNRSANVRSVNASSGGLLVSTLCAALVAAAILSLVWLPAEYGIDPTGIGQKLGLTQMGQIKEQLHVEAEADAVASLTAQSERPIADDSDIIQKLDAIQLQLTAITKTLEQTAQVQKNTAQDQKQTAHDTASLVWKDEVDYTLTPGEGIEIKLVMEEGASAEFEWSANGAVLNHDTHGDGGGQSISYEKGRSVPEQAGALKAAFTGNHGWFWRNRTAEDVVVSLRTRGDYSAVVLP